MHDTGIEREFLVQHVIRETRKSGLKVRSPSFNPENERHFPSPCAWRVVEAASEHGGPVGWHGECGVESRHYVPPSNGARTRNRAYRVSSPCFHVHAVPRLRNGEEKRQSRVDQRTGRCSDRANECPSRPSASSLTSAATRLSNDRWLKRSAETAAARAFRHPEPVRTSDPAPPSIPRKSHRSWCRVKLYSAARTLAEEERSASRARMLTW